uniref:Uncharacterized protein n=1 Tax=mine drainage metagenome TaxID=410659 RepID=E6QN20_9ZZZZ
MTSNTRDSVTKGTSTMPSPEQVTLNVALKVTPPHDNPYRHSYVAALRFRAIDSFRPAASPTAQRPRPGHREKRPGTARQHPTLQPEDVSQHRAAHS